MLVISDKNDKNWGVYVQDTGLERHIYTRPIEYDGIAPREARLESFSRAYKIVVDPLGTLYTYPIER